MHNKIKSPFTYKAASTKGGALILLIFAVAIATMSMFVMHASEKSETRKARYYYGAGMEQVALNNFGEAMEYFNKAYKLDSLSPEIGLAYAKLQYDENADSAEVKRLLNLFRRYTEAYPDDYFEAKIYADLASDWGKNPAEGTRVLEKVLKIHPSDTQIYFILAQLYSAIDSINAAKDALARYERVEGADVGSTTQRIMLALHQGDTIGAKGVVSSFADAHPRQPEAWLLKAALYQTTGNPDSAVICYARAENVAPDNSLIKLETAKNYFFQLGDTVRAAAKLGEVMKGTDLDAEAKVQQIYEIDMGLMVNKMPRTWLKPVIETMIKVEGANPEICQYGASFFESVGDTAKALEMRRELYDLDHSDIYNLSAYMVSLFHADKYPELTKIYESLEADGNIARDSLPMEAWLTSAFAYQQLGNLDKASEINLDRLRMELPGYETSISPEAYKQMIASHESQKSSMQNAISLTRNIADISVLQGDTLRAFNVYNQLIAIDPDDPLTLNNYAYYLCLKGERLDDAKTMSEKAMAADPDNPTYVDTYAYILFMLKDYTTAELYQKMAIDKALSNQGPNAVSAEYFDHYGDILFMNGDTTSALENWTKALELEPSNKLIQKKVQQQRYIEK